MPSTRLPLLCVALLPFCVVPGCRNKTVTLLSEPPGATVSLVRIDPVTAEVSPVRGSGDVTPMRTSLSFSKNERYKATFSKEQFLEDAVEIDFEPQDRTSYSVKLTRYLADLMTFPFEPVFEDRAWVLKPAPEPTLSYVLSVMETNNPNATKLTRITSNTSPDVDFRGVVASPTEDLIAYQRVERRPAKPITYVAQSGETLESIAEKHRITVDRIWQSNPDLPSSGRVSGRTLRIEQDDYLSRVMKQAGDRPPVRISNDQANEFAPAFTGFGDAIVFPSTSYGANATLWIVATSGGGTKMTRVTRSDSLDFDPSVGQEYLVYTSLPPRAQVTQPQIWSARINGDEASKLADGHSPAISADDRRILYLAPHGGASGGPGINRLWVINSDGSSPSALTTNSDYTIIDPAWSPDGRWILFASDAPDDGMRDFDLYLMPADGSSNPIRLTTNDAYDSSPVFDRTGRQVYFRSNRGGAWNVWRLDLPSNLLKSSPTQ